MKYLVIFIINIYQKTLSPDHGWLRPFYPHGFCRYHPSCSEYCKQSVRQFGVVRGLYLGGKRLLRCNPWASFGLDPVPQKFEF